MEKYKELARQVLSLAETRLLSRLRFLSSALTAVRYRISERDELFATDGQTIWYHPRRVLGVFQQNKDAIAVSLQHVLFHCLMGHPFERHEKDNRLWNLACDMAAEQIRLELEEKAGSADAPGRSFREEQRGSLSCISDYAGGSTAQKFYNYFVDAQMPDEELTILEALFFVDSHRLWSVPQKKRGAGKGSSFKSETQKKQGGEVQEDDEVQAAGGETQSEEAAVQKKRSQWKRIAAQVKTELDIFQKKQGLRAGSLLAGLAPFLFEEVDYTQFLRLFASEQEILHVSDEEFDVIYYTYGLEKYGNVPLIEPLEYSDTNRIREFVIAIDTSGSVQGEIVEEFLRRTCGVLRQTESFAGRVNIYIVQCDAQIQQCVQISDLNELECYIRDLKLSGFGGTDFRPVFAFVDRLLEEQRIRRLNGLLYFTDGVGTYPEAASQYKTAFIFHREDYISPSVPGWAIRAVLTSDNIKVVKEKL